MLPANWQQYLPPLVFILILLGMFYGVVLRPAALRQKKHLELISSLKVGDRIVTAGGIHGQITEVREQTLGVEIARGVTITLERRAIRRKQDQEDF